MGGLLVADLMGWGYGLGGRAVVVRQTAGPFGFAQGRLFDFASLRSASLRMTTSLLPEAGFLLRYT
jgi:hypothetical protein